MVHFQPANLGEEARQTEAEPSAAFTHAPPWVPKTIATKNAKCPHLVFVDATHSQYGFPVSIASIMGRDLAKLEAVARLFAAAPDLVRELMRAVDMADPTGIDSDYDPARAAIARALGHEAASPAPGTTGAPEEQS